MKKNSFLKNVLVLLISQGIIKIVGIVYKLYLTNKPGYADIGNALFAGAFQVYTMFLTVCSIGVPNAIASLVSEKFAIGDSKGAYRILKTAIGIFGLIGFLASTFLYFYSNVISAVYLEMPETSLILKILAPSIFIVAITSVFKGYFNGKQKMNVTANSLTIEQISRAIFIIILVESFEYISYNNTIVLTYAVGIATTLGDIISIIYIIVNFLKTRQEIWTDIITSKSFKNERKIVIIRNIFKVSFPIALCALIATLNKTIDAVTVVRIIKNYLGEKEAVRLYGILSGKIESMIVFPLSFNMALTTVLIPTVSEQKAKGDNKKAKELLKQTMIIGILFGLPCFLVLFIFPTEILNLLFPRASSGSGILKYSSFTIIIILLIQTINSYLQGIKKMKIQIISVGIGSIIKLILNIILLNDRRIGIYGAVIANLVSYLSIISILLYYLIRKEKIKFKISTFIIKPLLIVILMYNIITVINKINIIQNEIFKLIFTLIISGIIYLVLIILIVIFPKKNNELPIFGKHKT